MNVPQMTTQRKLESDQGSVVSSKEKGTSTGFWQKKLHKKKTTYDDILSDKA